MHYLNYAALCPTRTEAEQEVQATLEEFRRYLYSEAGIRWYEQKVKSSRKKVARLLNVADPSSIAFVPNASMASHLVFSFLDWQPGDTLLTTTHENPSVLREMDWLAHRGVKVHRIDLTTPEDLVSSIEKLVLSRSVKAFVLSHVSHVDGRILPIDKIGVIAKEHNVVFIVDGAQAVGHIPVDLLDLDFDVYFFPGHKWCCGPLGTGALVMHDHFLSSNPAFRKECVDPGKPNAMRFEIGTHNTGLIAGLAKACELKHQEGLGTPLLSLFREEARQELVGMKAIQIVEWGGNQAPGILTFRCLRAEDCQAVLIYLEATDNIVVKPFTDYPKGLCPAIRLFLVPRNRKEHRETGSEHD